MKSTLYEILELSGDASSNQIKLAYRELAKAWHPDKNTEPGATARFQEISYAYEILSDPQKKAIYDQDLKNKNTECYESQQVPGSGRHYTNVNNIVNEMYAMLSQRDAARKKVEKLALMDENERIKLLESDKTLFKTLLDEAWSKDFVRIIPWYSLDLLKEIIESKDILTRFACCYIEQSFQAILQKFSASQRWLYLQKKVNQDTILHCIYTNFTLYPCLNRKNQKLNFEKLILDPELYFDEFTSLIGQINNERLFLAATALKEHLYKEVKKQKKSLIDLQYGQSMQVLRSTIMLIQTLTSNPEDSLLAINNYYKEHLTNPNKFQSIIANLALISLGLVCGGLLASALFTAISLSLVATPFFPGFVFIAFAIGATIGACTGAVASKCISPAKELNNLGFFQSKLQHNQIEIVETAKLCLTT